MSSPEREKFDATVGRTLADRRLQHWLADFQVLAQEAHDAVLGELDDVEAWRDELSDVRAHTVAHLDHYLDQFAANVEGHGGHVFVAGTAAEARDYVLNVAREAQVQSVVKSKSMVTAEIELNEALETAGIEVVETDLGEFIVQLTGEAPYHIIAPALHMTLDQIRELFSKEAGMDLPRDADALAAFARARLREKFFSADLGISGANFGIASTGTVVLVTNEGNGRLSTTLPRTHVVVMGIERLLPDWQSLDCALTLLTRAGTGQRISTYVSAITGPRRESDDDGPDDLHVVLVDNGRSRILGTKYEPVLKCIRCGSCADFCPVYGVIGGHAYDSVYTGPIGAVLTPLLYGLDGHVELPYASSLCGACRDACPARVPLTDLLLELRADAARRGRQPSSWRAGFRGYAAATARPSLWDAGVRAAAWLARPCARDGFVRSAPGLLGKWTAARDLRAPVLRSFRRRSRGAMTRREERR